MEHFKCPSGVGLPHRYPEQLATPFWLPQKCKRGGGLVFHRSLLFRPNFPKTQAAIGDHTKKCNIYFFVHFGGVFSSIFFAYFSSFLTLIRATLGFFVVFPNKSYTLIRATLGFELFGPNKSSCTLIRATFRVF